MTTSTTTTSEQFDASSGIRPGVVVDDPNRNEDMYSYLYGFGNTLQSECLPGALPIGRNNPRIVPYELYAEQLSGTSFTAPRATNRRTWLYRMQPSVVVGSALMVVRESNNTNNDNKNPTLAAAVPFGGVHPHDCSTTPANPLRWNPFPLPSSSSPVNFVEGIKLICTAGESKAGIHIYMYSCNADMKFCPPINNQKEDKPRTSVDQCMYNADGDFLIVPQQGILYITTEVGRLKVAPTELVVIPRGMIFQINLCDTTTATGSPSDTTTSDPAARGYILEVDSDRGLQLPELGPIGSNGLANARDFCYPTAWCISDPGSYHQSCQIIVKMQGLMHTKISNHSPFNVVAWHGNLLPFKYNLQRFCAVNSVTYDHLDPSIYTVLTSPTDRMGTALVDVVVFPPRVMATDSNTLRPPWFHRNTMSEFMGLILGQYDAKMASTGTAKSGGASGSGGGGFQPGGASLHNCMVPHGPDTSSYSKAVADPCELPTVWKGGWAFMFETYLPLRVAPHALIQQKSETGGTDDTTFSSWLDIDYATCWKDLHCQFTAWTELQQSMLHKNAAPDGTAS